MAYISMKRLIENEKIKLENGMSTKEEFDLYKKQSLKKLDVFLACDRMTSEQYTELVGMLS